MSPTHTSIPVAHRVRGFTYAIRNIAVEAARVEATGRHVTYLNVGNPPAFGFGTPAHLIAAVERAMRDGHNGYGPSAGIAPAREAVAVEYTRRGWPTTPDRVFVTAGTSEAIDLALSALVDPGSEVLVPLPDYPMYTAILAKLDARAVFYPTDPARGWTADIGELGRLITPITRAIIVIDPNNPTGALYPTAFRRGVIELAERNGLVILADEVYGDLAFEGPVAPLGSLAPDAAIISLSSLSKGYLAPGWRTGWLAIGRSPKLDDLIGAIGKLADGRLCSTVPMQFAIAAALGGDRSHQETFRAALAERAAVTTTCLNAMTGVSCVAPRAAFYAMPRVHLPPGRTDEAYVLALLRETGILTVHGSGFGMDPADGYFRVVFLASPDQLRDVYRVMDEFNTHYLR